MDLNTEHRLTDLERRMSTAEELNRNTAGIVNKTAELVSTQAVQMGIVWSVMKLGGSLVLAAILGLVLSSAFGRKMDTAHAAVEVAP